MLALVFDGVLIATCLYAVVRGGSPERIGAGINITASGLTTALRLANATFYAPAQLVVLSIDALVMAGFYLLAIKTTRFWPIWAFGFALADLFVSLAGGILPKTPLFAYHTGLGAYAYLALASLAVGTYCLSTHESDGARDEWQRPKDPTRRSLDTRAASLVPCSDECLARKDMP